MSHIAYLQPDIVRGRTTGGFHVVHLQSEQNNEITRSNRSLAFGVMTSVLGSVALWGLLVTLIL